MKKLFLVVLNYKGWQNTIDCVKSLKKVRIPQGFTVEIVIIDNNSLDNSIYEIKKEFPKIKIIESRQNLGYSGGNNIGIQHALSHGASHIMIINNDTLFTRDSVFELVEGLRKQSVDVVCPKIYFEKGYEYHKDRYKSEDLGKVFWFAGGEMDFKNVIGHHRGVDEVDHGQYDNDVEINFITGACFLSTADALQKTGTFDERYFLYYEDADLSVRFRKRGFKIGFVPKSVIYHKNAGSTGGSGSTLQDYYISRNRLLFGITYAPLRAKLALIRESTKTLIKGRHWQKKGVFDFYLGRFGRGSYPVAR